MTDKPDKPDKPKTLTEIFNEAFPIYLVYGMTPEQFWDDDPALAKHFKTAFELKRELQNETMWIMGLYVRKAVANAVNGNKAKYPEEPFPFVFSTSKRIEHEKEEVKVQKSAETFAAMAEIFNAARREKEKQKNMGGAT